MSILDTIGSAWDSIRYRAETAWVGDTPPPVGGGEPSGGLRDQIEAAVNAPADAIDAVRVGARDTIESVNTTIRWAMIIGGVLLAIAIVGAILYALTVAKALPKIVPAVAKVAVPV